MDYPKLTLAEYVSEYKIRLSFSDGLITEVNFEHEVIGGIFDALRDPVYFRSFTYHEQFGSIQWPNGAGFAPEFLYQRARESVQLLAKPTSSRKLA